MSTTLSLISSFTLQAYRNTNVAWYMSRTIILWVQRYIIAKGTSYFLFSDLPTTILLVQIAWELNFNMQGQYVVIFITWAMQHLYLPIFTCQNTAAYRKYMFVIKNGETTKSYVEKRNSPGKLCWNTAKECMKTISNHVASYKGKTALYHFCMDCEL